MAGKRRKKAAPQATQVDVPIAANAPAPELPPPPEGEAGDVLRGGKKPPCAPEPMVPTNAGALVNNALCREIAAPNSKKPADDTVDPQVVLLDELAQGITYGTDLNHIKDDIIRISSYQAEKAELFNVIMRGIDLNRARDFVLMRANAERHLLAASMRGDLKSPEYLAFLNYSNTELASIAEKLAEQHPLNTGESEGLVSKVDHTKRTASALEEEAYKETTPQGREIIRRHVYKLRTKIAAAVKEETVAAPVKKRRTKNAKSAE